MIISIIYICHGVVCFCRNLDLEISDVAFHINNYNWKKKTFLWFLDGWIDEMHDLEIFFEEHFDLTSIFGTTKCRLMPNIDFVIWNPAILYFGSQLKSHLFFCFCLLICLLMLSIFCTPETKFWKKFVLKVSQSVSICICVWSKNSPHLDKLHLLSISFISSLIRFLFSRSKIFFWKIEVHS